MTNGTGISFVRSPEVNAKATGSEVISETGENEEFYPVLLSIEPTESNGVLVPGTYTVGTNAPDYNNIASLAALVPGLALQNLLLSCVKVEPETEIRVKVVTASTASGNHKFKVRMFGNLVTV